MAVQVQLKTINCPTCGDALRYEQVGDTVVCMSCGNSVTINETKAQANENVETQSVAKSSKVEEIKTSSTALAYIEQYLSDYDWESFAFDYDFTIDELDALVNNLKVVAADDHRTWLAAFTCLVVPFSKKLEYRKKSLAKIIEEYKNKNLDAYGMYDAYKKVAKVIVAKHKEVKEQATKILDYAKKYGAEESDLAQCEAIVNGLKVKEMKDTIFDKMEDIPEIIKIKEAEQKALVEELAGLGIDAESLYLQAMEDKQQNQYKQAIEKFLTLKDYKDSKEQVEKIENSFLFEKVLSIKGKLYYLDKVGGNAGDLLEIVDGKLGIKPVIKGVLSIVATYANTIYFLSPGSGASTLCAYDFDTQKRELVCRGVPPTTKFKLDLGKSALFFVTEKQGVDSSKTYEFFKVNLADNTSQSCLSKMHKLVDFNNDDYFIFEKWQFVEQKRVGTTHIYETKTGTTYTIDKGNINVCGFVDGQVVFTATSPDDYNKDLYIAPLGEEITPTLLELNVAGNCQIFDRKIYYYTLDNNDRKYLISINADGTNRTELTNYVKEILFISGKWIYFIKAYGYNSALYRMTTDGTKTQLIASQIDEFLKIAGGYMHYIDTSRKVHKVRMDGTRNTILCSAVEKVLTISDDKIVFIALDKLIKTVLGLNGSTTKQYNKSIYAIDFNTTGRRKAVYDIIDGECFDGKTVFVTKKKEQKNATMPASVELYTLNLNDYSVEKIADLKKPLKTGCYVATCVYGSYDCPEVWTLRRYRDDTLGATWYGRAFIRLYYAISPTIVKLFGKTKWFKKMWKGKLDKMVQKLNEKGVDDTPYQDKEW